MLTVAMPLEAGTVSTEKGSIFQDQQVAMPLEVGTVSTELREPSWGGCVIFVAMPLEVGTVSTSLIH